MRNVVWLLLLVLVVLHQFDPFADDARLVAGFVPVTLVYHAGISIGAAITWFLATRYAWPTNAEVAAGGGKDERAG